MADCVMPKVGQLWRFKPDYCADQRVFMTTKIDDTHLWFELINEEDDCGDAIRIDYFVNNHVIVSDV